MNVHALSRYCCAAALSVCLAGCGQYGDLYLPPKPAAKPQQQPADPATPPDRTPDTNEEP